MGIFSFPPCKNLSQVLYDVPISRSLNPSEMTVMSPIES
jgi:hypothetical protein